MLDTPPPASRPRDDAEALLAREPARMPPDLNDPAQRADYRRELRAVGRPVRWLGVALAVIAAAMAAARHWAPHIPVAVPVFLVVIAALHLLAGIVIRAHHHQARMRS